MASNLASSREFSRGVSTQLHKTLHREGGRRAQSQGSGQGGFRCTSSSLSPGLGAPVSEALMHVLRGGFQA